jgi:hypothetical protein
VSDAEWIPETRPVDPELERASDVVAYRLEKPEWATFAEKMEGATPAQLYAIFGGLPVEPNVV